MTIDLRLITTLCLLCSLSLLATEQQDLDSLEHYLSLRDTYDQQKRERIQQLTDNKAIFDEYASFVYDSASLYYLRLQDESLISGLRDAYVAAQIKHGFLYLSGGLFKEAADILEDIDLRGTSRETQIEYYETYGRLLYDLADYNRSELAHDYKTLGTEMTDKALALLSPQDTARFWYLSALKDMKQENYPRALQRFQHQLDCQDITLHEKAITYSSMAYIYSLMGNDKGAQHYNILAAIYDIQNSTKEAVALKSVAQVLFREGDIERAARYIRIANDDAQYYNARHRKQDISELLPIIEGEQMRQINEKNDRIYTLTLFLYAILAVLVVMIIIIFNRMKALGQAKETIQEINESLREANKIKEEYLGTFLCWQSDFLSQLERYQRFVKKRVQEKRYDDILTTPNHFSANRKRHEFNKQFDEMFLRVFPQFVERFNALMREGERFEMKKGELLNTEMRIFALIRLGITDSEKIAQVLDCSVATVYTYKTRVRQRTDLTPAELLQKVMEI